MPFTLAHPAAAVPLSRRFGAYGVLSALVIGSMTPDMHYLFPFVTREETHSLGALFWFCLPVGFASYLIFHLFLKLPLFSLLPHVAAARLTPFVRPCALLPEARWSGVAVSLFSGALTHLAWDGLTHGGNFGFRSLDFVRAAVFFHGGHAVYVCDFLQGASSLAGMGLLVRWTVNWFRTAPVCEIGAPLFDFGRSSAVFFFFIAPQAAALLSILLGGHGLRYVIDRELVIAMSVLAISLMAYGLTWHFFRLCRRFAALMLR